MNHKIFFILIFVTLISNNTILKAEEISLMRDDFKIQKNYNKWRVPSYWQGLLEYSDDGGRKVLKLSSTTNRSKKFGRAHGRMLYLNLYAGTELLVSVTAKGNGDMRYGVLYYPMNTRRPEYLCETKILPNNYQKFETTLAIPYPCREILPFLEISKGDLLSVESMSISIKRDEKIELKAMTKLQIVGPDMPLLPVLFHTNLASSEINISQINISGVNDKIVWSELAQTDSIGNIVISPKNQGTGVSELAIAKSGNSSISYFITEDNTTIFEQSDKLAKQVKINLPTKILILGDSLSDFFRGYNYVDRLEFWLNKYNPNMVSITNAGIGGDHVMRVHDRLYALIGKAKPTYKQSYYDNIFKEKYDYVFIFLGQNDTVTKKSTNFLIPLTEPKVQYDGLKNIINFIRIHSPYAKIVLISPVPCCTEDINRARIQSNPEGDFGIYGKKEFIDEYDRINRQFCSQLNLDYVDILHPMRVVEDQKSLYIKDGVHLSPAGGRIIANELLKYFIQQTNP